MQELIEVLIPQEVNDDRPTRVEIDPATINKVLSIYKFIHKERAPIKDQALKWKELSLSRCSAKITKHEKSIVRKSELYARKMSRVDKSARAARRARAAGDKEKSKREDSSVRKAEKRLWGNIDKIGSIQYCFNKKQEPICGDDEFPEKMRRFEEEGLVAYLECVLEEERAYKTQCERALTSAQRELEDARLEASEGSIVVRSAAAKVERAEKCCRQQQSCINRISAKMQLHKDCHSHING